MKKLLLVVATFVLIGFLVAFSPIQDAVDKVDEILRPDYEKIEDAEELLVKILEHLAQASPKISLEAGQLVDSELGTVRFEVLPYSEITHFNPDDVKDGYIVRPVVTSENSKLLIVLQAEDKDSSLALVDDLKKVKSDQWRTFADAGMMTKYLLNNCQIVRQGTYLIYVAWENPTDIVKVFERHVK